MDPPYVLSEGLDVQFFESLERVILEVEVRDVKEGVFRVYDSSGRRIELGVESRRQPVFFGLSHVTEEEIVIRSADAAPIHQTELKQLLRDFCEAVEVPVKEPEREDLPRLIEIGVERLGIVS